MSAPNVNTAAWRLPSHNRAGEKRAGRFDRNAYEKLGLAEVVERADGVKDRPPSDDYVEQTEGRASVGTGGLPSVDTSGWSLKPMKEERAMRSGAVAVSTKKPKGPASERGKKWDANPPTDRRGKPMLYGGDNEEEDLSRTAVRMAGKAEMKGLSMDRIAQLRRLAGLERAEEIEFSTGTPHRRMPSEDRAVPVQEGYYFTPGDIWVAKTGGGETYFAPLSQAKNGNFMGLQLDLGFSKKPKKKSVHKKDRTGGFWKTMDSSHPHYREILGYFKAHSDFTPKQESSLSKLPPEVRRLVEPAPRLPSGGHVPHRATGSGVLDPVTEGVEHGHAYIDRVLAESKWFLKDFPRLGVSRGLGEEPGREAWSGSDPDYSDDMVDPDPDVDDDFSKAMKTKVKPPPEDDTDDEEPDGEEDDMDEGARIVVKHTRAGGKGHTVRQKRQSSSQRHYNRSAAAKLSKKNYERSAKGRAKRRLAQRLAKHSEVDEAFEITPEMEARLEAIREGKIGNALKRIGGRMSHGTARSRRSVDKLKDRIRNSKFAKAIRGED